MELTALPTEKEREALRPLLTAAGLRLPDGLDYMAAIQTADGFAACGGTRGDVIEGVAVDGRYRGEGLLGTLMTHLVGRMLGLGHDNIFLFTKPANRSVFEPFGFRAVAATQDALLMERRRDGAAAYIASIPRVLPGGKDRIGAVVLNGNPFTNGHRHLLMHAAARCAAVYAFVVESERTWTPFAERIRLAKAGCAGLANVLVVRGGPYIISPATFPTYFLKEDSDAAAIHACLDAAVFAERIAPALSISARFVGEEPLDPMTRSYNRALHETLPARGIAVEEIPRLLHGGEPVSASRVRALAERGAFDQIGPLVPQATLDYLRGRK